MVSSVLSAVPPVIKNEFPVFRLTRDTRHLVWWKSRLFWLVYMPFARLCYKLGLPTIIDNDGVRLELQCIATTRAVANAFCGVLGTTQEPAFYVPAPVDVTVPKSNVRYQGNVFPFAEKAEIYSEHARQESPVLCPHTGALCRPHEGLKRSDVVKLYDQASNLLEEARTAVAGT